MVTMLAIHDQPGNFSNRWIAYCEQNGIHFKLINCRGTNVIDQLDGVDGLLWNWLHYSPEDQLVARQIIAAVERMGIHVFPNALTSWHYDDKIMQKYLLEAIQAPLIPTYVFVDKKEALDWIEKTSFPKVFKLRCGAGSSNVSLVKSRIEAVRICREMFGKGRLAASGGYFSDIRRKIRTTPTARQFMEKMKRLPKSLRNSWRMKRLLPRQLGYVYFQDYLPGNAFDTRITVIGDRAFAYRRMNRPGDFRASGSGNPDYDMSAINTQCISVAFETAKRLESQSLAFDFLYDSNGDPRIGEISYTFVAHMVHDCPGHWDRAMTWHEGHLWPQDCIIQDFVSAIVAAGDIKIETNA